ncbi:MAG: hypothetical protein HPZ91_00885 [Lentisphaeria bacterium]|nr:hypothetical protein [Lentisphaeria bacterium]
MKFFLTIAVAVFAAAAAQAAIFDSIQFGEKGSERSHGFLGKDTRALEEAALGETARELLPQEPVSWQGGNMKFKMRVNPQKPNYVTVKFWGGDVNENLLILYIDGKQVGYRHLGDVDILDHGSSAPAVPGRFYYVTVPIPMSATYRKDRVEFEIAATGRIWGYGRDFEQYQKDMTTPSRGVYRFYVHDDGFFVPPADEKQGVPPEPIPPKPEKESFDALEERVNREIGNWLKPNWTFRSQMHMQMAAQAYSVEWTKAYRNPEIVKKLVDGIDGYFLRYSGNPKLARDDRSTYNPDWFGFGPAGDVIRLLWKEFEPYLDKEIKDCDGKPVVRRKAWAGMLEAGVRHLSAYRRQYTNQSMIIDLNLYLNNRALRLLDPSKGLPPDRTLGFLYESVGLEPWSGPVDAKGGPTWPLGKEYRQLTAKSLTKELGYVGVYGEVLDWVTAIYNATRPSPDQPGDRRIREALSKMIRARSFFRYPTVDAQSNPVMRMETVIGWRDTTFPGDVTYAQRPSRDASVLQATAATLDPYAVGLVRQMFGQRQFFPSVEHQLKEGGFRVTFGLLHTPEQYKLLKKQPASSSRMPMSEGEPDFVFSDEENGVIAVKDGKEILYASLYWRARHGINFLARIHHITPALERIATVRQEIEFRPSGMTFLRRNWTNFGFATGGLTYPDKRDSVHVGETLPIAWIPDGVSFKPGQESPYAGRGDFYRLAYGPYLVGQNTTAGRIFKLTIPEGKLSYRQLPTGRTFKPGETVEVGPMSTAVLKQVQ